MYTLLLKGKGGDDGNYKPPNPTLEPYIYGPLDEILLLAIVLGIVLLRGLTKRCLTKRCAVT